MSIESAMLTNHLILCCPLLLLPSIFPSIRVFSSELALCIRWPKYWSSSFSISPSNEYSRLISFRIDWQSKGLFSLLQYHNSKTSILWHLAFFMVQLLHLYMTTGKTIALTIWTFVGKVMSLFFNTLSSFVRAFPSRSKHHLFSWLQSPSAVILESKKIKSDTASTFSFSVCHEVVGLNAMILVFGMLSFKPAFSLSSFTLNKRFFSSSLLSAIRVIKHLVEHPLILACLMFSHDYTEIVGLREEDHGSYVFFSYILSAIHDHNMTTHHWWCWPWSLDFIQLSSLYFSICFNSYNKYVKTVNLKVLHKPKMSTNVRVKFFIW